MQIEQMPMVRIFFEKTGRAKYISHLDTMRTLTRALRRSGLPLWYTQGFNPHLYMTFALPLALGLEGLRESMDLRMTEAVEFAEVTDRLNAVLPRGFRAVEAAAPVMQPAKITWADYDVGLLSDKDDSAELADSFRAFLEQPVIEVRKRTKKGEKTIDIRPLCRAMEIKPEEGALMVSLRMAAGIQLNISPNLLLDAFSDGAGWAPEVVRITRTAILTDTLEPFA